jgi:hypothetical protein
MKKFIILISAFLMISLMGVTQIIEPEKVPADTQQAFAKKFPSATDTKYEMGKKDYEVSFKENGIAKSANFNTSGEWLETVTMIAETDLPKQVLTSVARNFAGFTMSIVSKVENSNKVEYYEMYLKMNTKSYDVKFSPKGVVLKKTRLKI